VTYSQGTLAGLQIAMVFLKHEIIKSPNSKKLKRLWIELEIASQQEKTNIRLQALNNVK
jgi:hypothetical protein